MPLLHLPDVPAAESRSFKQRILAKYDALQANRAAGKVNELQIQGECYEIAVALHLYRHHLLNRSDYLSRKEFPGEVTKQSINMGWNNEYDFLLADSNGLLLGEIKNYSQGLGEYIKKAVSYCLLDRWVLHRENRLAGFCFATPAESAAMFRRTLRNALEILTVLTDCSGITGMNSQLLPSDLKIHFRARYLATDNQTIREDLLSREPDYYLKELEDHAGFTFQFLQVAPLSAAILAQQMQMLETKQRWFPTGHTA
jgi:hypothetical protein